jgi:hypothetical protein
VNFFLAERIKKLSEIVGLELGGSKATQPQVEASNHHDEQSRASATLAVPPYLDDVSAMFSIPFDDQRSAGNLVELNAEWNSPPTRYSS